MPRLAIARDGIGGDHELAHDGGQRDLAGPPVLPDQPIIEIPEGRGMANGGAGGIEQGLAQAGAAVTGRFAVTDRAAAPSAWRQTSNPHPERDPRQLKPKPAREPRHRRCMRHREQPEPGGAGRTVRSKGGPHFNYFNLHDD